MLQYMLCVSRFAHYVKVLGRDKMGSFAEYDELEKLNNLKERLDLKRFLHELKRAGLDSLYGHWDVCVG